MKRMKQSSMRRIRMIPTGEIKKNAVSLVRNHTSFYTEVKIRSVLNKDFLEKHIRANQECRDKLRKKNRSDARPGRIRAVFMCQVPSIWNSQRSVFEAACRDAGIEEYLLALPEKKFGKNRDFDHEEYGDNEAYDFCRSFYEKTINAYDEKNKKWFDLGSIRPDYVFLSRPYECYLPPEYAVSKISEYARVCYIPYAQCIANWAARYIYELDFVDRIYAVFTENLSYRAMLEKIYHGIFKADWKKIKFLGYPRLDLYYPPQRKKRYHEKTVLWLPRWTTDNAVGATAFFKYKDVLISYFRKHREVRFIFRPHPFMLRNFISVGEMSEKEVKKFLRMFSEEENFIYDESGDYLPVFQNTDIFISDATSLLIEELAAGSPVIYCGKMSYFDKYARTWAKLMYCVKTEKDLVKRLDSLLKGVDKRKRDRIRYVREHLTADGETGRRVVGFLKHDFADVHTRQGV